MEPSASHPVIEVHDAVYGFGGEGELALRVPRLRIDAHEHTAITGPSGCGKTTLLRLISGVLVPEHGSIDTLGVGLDRLSTKARGKLRIRSIGMVFQSFALFEYLTAMENILVTAKLNGSDVGEAREYGAELARRVGIDYALNRRPTRLSQGERQRVAICRALVGKPKLVLCDEPTGNLDKVRAHEIVDLLIEESDRIGATVLTVTHDPGLLDRFHKALDMREFSSLERGAM